VQRSRSETLESYSIITAVTGNCTYQGPVTASIVAITTIHAYRPRNAIERESVTLWCLQLRLRYGRAERCYCKSVSPIGEREGCGVGLSGYWVVTEVDAIVKAH